MNRTGSEAHLDALKIMSCISKFKHPSLVSNFHLLKLNVYICM